MTGLRRHIAFAAILIASMVMFAHAVVPHHHRASDLGVCTEADSEAPRVPCAHRVAGGGTVVEPGVYLFDADCACGCAGGVKCSPALPFTLRLGTDTSDRLCSSDPDGEMALPLFICDNCTNSHHHRASSTLSATGQKEGEAFLLADARLLAQYVPGATAGRAPPVL